jgi:hypothetical protein
MNIPIERLGCSDYKSKQHKMGTEDRIQEMYDLESVFKKLIEDSTKININSILKIRPIFWKVKRNYCTLHRLKSSFR